MLERGGELVTRVAGRRTKEAMHGLILTHVLPGTTVNTDEFGGYKDIDQCGYCHVKVNQWRGPVCDPRRRRRQRA